MSPLAYLLTALPALAAEGDARVLVLSCDSFAQVQSRITYCYDNREAVKAARACYDRIVKAWADATRDLDPVLSKALRVEPDSRQEAEFLNSRTDLARTVAKLDNLLDVTRRNTDVVASYYKSMYDVHEIKSPSESVPCFYEAYDDLSDIVWDFDDRIIEGQRTRDRAEEMRLTALGRDRHIDSTSANRVLEAVLPGPAAAPIPVFYSGQSANPASDITGIKEDQEKEALAPFPWKDQLTGP